MGMVSKSFICEGYGGSNISFIIVIDLEGIILQSSGLKVPKKEITEPNEFESSNKEKKKKKKKNKH